MRVKRLEDRQLLISEPTSAQAQEQYDDEEVEEPMMACKVPSHIFALQLSHFPLP
jgi:hypothetical protein